ncbi:filamentous hemagglutinin N-terminal domain-containing protein [filamentous cyanobacterium LEGE 11480]|uniref:Filamentous hemagglutinin N-terminal domain-containing protein n=1 Tax=Romeriopsis navalis LEGE 11480 TaxID=2777977 RepID=A0A928VN56_9CYAN|nr:filamentous hemagglutinin N-terminal domain-containing protein [Romeriopsis navalis]MBE9029039.1 filamentous hemagglutinin N-terminal domain-containing protein [Romeriopsis navalis LEGE 11480]
MSIFHGNDRQQRLKLLYGFSLGIATCSLFSGLFAQSSLAQITPTTNWGIENTRLNVAGSVNGQPALLIEGGAARGSNLFHSFQQLNVSAGELVYFSNPAGISTIFSRIIGGQPSNILGTIGVNGLANLFLLNPQGIIFGPDAQLDIRGAFTATTANTIQFGNQGEFTIAPSSAPTLLTISPSSLNFAANQGAVINQAPNLQNLNRGSIALLGSQVNMDGGGLTVPGGRVSLSGIKGNGAIALQLLANQLQIISTTGTPADVFLGNGAKIDVRSDDAGSVDIQSNNLTMQGDGTSILAGIAPNSGTAQSLSGPVNILAAGNLRLDDRAVIDHSVLAGGVGNTGSTVVNAQKIIFENLGHINTELLGVGRLGEIQLTSRENILFQGGSSEGGIRFLPAINQAFERSGIFRRIGVNGNGTIGSTTINGSNISLLNGGGIGHQINGIGEIRSTFVNATGAIQLDQSGTADTARSNISLQITENGQGLIDDVIVNGRSLNIENGSEFVSALFGKGSTGGFQITLQDDFVLNGFKPRPPRTRVSTVNTILQDSGEGTIGDVSISANNIFIRDGGSIPASSIGLGNGGNITLIAKDQITIEGVNSPGFRSRIAATVTKQSFPDAGTFGRGEGKAGNISITGNRVSVLDGAFINASISDTVGQAGQVTIDAAEFLRVAGTGRSVSIGFSNGRIQITPITVKSLISAETGGNTQAVGGSIQINTPNLIVEQDGLIDTSTISQGKGGNIAINSPNILIASGGQVRTSTTDTGEAGKIEINSSGRLRVTGKSAQQLRELELLNSGILARTTTNSSGGGGSIVINANQVIADNEGLISVSSDGDGVAGQLNLNAKELQLRDQGQLLAETRGNTGGNILLNLSDVLLLRRGGGISTSAGTAQLGGDGGRIDIRTPFIVSVPGENSDIAANAFSGAGGQVNINALNLFGIVPKTRFELEQLLQVSDPSRLDPNLLTSNDITAISQTSPTLSGDVRISQLDVDPTQAAARLPDDLLDRSNLINQNLCRIAQGSQFILTGRGGLPSSPTVRQMTPRATWEDIRLRAPTVITKGPQLAQATRNNQAPPIEAQSWYRSFDGKIHLITQIQQAQPRWRMAMSCNQTPINSG